ncbi:MAG: DLW-39 family protein [Mycobacteriales bacterium]
MRRPALLVALLGAGAFFWRRKARSGRAERDLWTEATATPDLR